MYVIGVDIGGTKCAVNLAECVDNQIHLLEKRRFLTKVERGPEAILLELESYIEEFVSATGGRVEAIGISCGGPLDQKSGTVLSPSNLPGWDEIRIVDRFHERFGLPAFLENDANAGALAEWKLGAGRGKENVAFLTFGTGLGAGLILNGQLYTGAGGLAGELGHWKIGNEPGPLNYGKTGSFQSYSSGNGISAWYRYLAKPDDMITTEQVADLARHGDPIAQKVFLQSAEKLGYGLSFLIDLLSLEVVTIGGIFDYAYDLLWPKVEAILKCEVLPANLAACKVIPAGLGRQIGDYAGCIVAMLNHQSVVVQQDKACLPSP